MKGAESWFFRKNTLSCLQEIRRHIWLILRGSRELKKMKAYFEKQMKSHFEALLLCVLMLNNDG